jgi:hypothetical protein
MFGREAYAPGTILDRAGTGVQDGAAQSGAALDALYAAMPGAEGHWSN